MSKIVVLLMQNEYPFMQSPSSSRQPHNILVRQSLSPTRTATKNTLLAKANFLKNLKNRYLVKVDSLFQQQQNIHIMYEYVDTKFTNVIKEASLMLISKIHAQLREFGIYLSNIGVRILLRMDRIGIGEHQGLKYFMGLDFQWEDDPDQEFLLQFYQKQIEELLGGYLKQKSIKASIIPESTTGQSFARFQQQPSHLNLNNSNNPKLRKISYSTLPSRYNRICKIDEKLKQIKSTSKIKIKIHQNQPTNKKSPNNNYNNNSAVHSTHSKSRNKFDSNLLNVGGNGKKFQDRKYSGEVRYHVESKDRLYDKESDIQSQYWHRKKKFTPKQEESMNSEVESNKTKSRTEEMKQKEYRELSSMKKDYLKDFISVLQQDEDNNMILPPTTQSINLKTQPQQVHQPQIPNSPDAYPHPQNVQQNQKQAQKPRQRQFCLKRTDSVMIGVSTEQLQQMAKQAIEHSMKVMSMFKQIMHDS